jgi:osmoprotectant transport system substrate-binding protein
MRILATSTLFIAMAGLAACGEKGSSGTAAPQASGAGCAPVAGDTLVVLDDDKKLQTADNIIAVVNGKVRRRGAARGGRQGRRRASTPRSSSR